MTLYAGIDCGTQGTKVVIVDSAQGVILGEGSALTASSAIPTAGANKRPTGGLTR